MSNTTRKILKLAAGFVLLLGATYCIYSAFGTEYMIFPNPAVEDARKVDIEQCDTISHFNLVEEVSFDGITRHPTPEDICEEVDGDWVLVSKARAAACTS